jgi:hypothetical protein
MMIYTSGDWMVKPGREEEFIEAWHDLAEWTAAEIAPGAPATLLRDAMNLPTFGALDHGTAMSRSLRGGKARASWRGLGGFANFLTDSRPTPWMWSLTWAARCREPSVRAASGFQAIVVGQPHHVPGKNGIAAPIS